MGDSDPPPTGGGIPPDISMLISHCDERPGPLKRKKDDQEVQVQDSTPKKTLTPASSMQHVFVVPEYEGNKRVLYSASDKGPFSVHITKKEDDRQVEIKLLKFAQFIHNKKIEGIVQGSVKSMGRYRVALEFSSIDSANRFAENPILKENNFIAVIPQYQVTRMGVVRDVPVEWTLEELVQGIECPANCGPVIKARRLNVKRHIEGTTTWLPSTAVVLTFAGQILPEKVFCFSTSLPVDLYKLPTIQCRKCCRFGHIRAHCRSKPRCFKCGLPHDGELCDTPSQDITCILCNGTHLASDPKCPEHSRQKAIKVIMAEKNITYSQASVSIPSVKKSYSEVLTGPVASQDVFSIASSPPQSPAHHVSYRKTEFRQRRPIPQLVEHPTYSLDTDSIEETAEGETRLDVPERNGNEKILKRIETVPDIKRDTSGITTQYIAASIVNLGALAAGVCVAWSSSALPLLTPGHPDISVFSALPNGTHLRVAITQSEASWVASLLCLGAFFGAVPTGLISEYFGRKKTLLYLALPLVVSWILVASSPNVYGLYVGRLVGGVAVGAFSVSVPPYIEDIAEKPLLSTLANFYHLQFACGVLFGYIIGMVNSASWHCLLCSSIPVAFFIAFIFLPESPVYLMSQGKFAEAKTSLRYFRGIDNDVDTELKQMKEYIRNSLKHKVTFKELFSTKATIKALVVSFGLMIFQQLSGIYPILFFADSVFKPFDLSLNPPGGAIILGFCLVTATYFSSLLLKTIRRRVLLIISLTSMAVSLGSLATYYHFKASNSLSSNSTWVPLLTLCVYVSMYSTGIGPIPWLMLREIFPPNVTRRATAIAAGFHWFLAFGVTKLYQNLIEKVSPGWTLWHFAVTCLVGTIFIYFFVPETKGRSLQDIQDEFDGIHRNKKHKHVIEVECYPE